MSEPVHRPSARHRPRRGPVARGMAAALAAAGLLAAAALPAHAASPLTHVVAAGQLVDDPTGAPQMVGNVNEFAKAQAGLAQTNAVNVGNWVGGPFTDATAVHYFGVQGPAGTYTELNFHVTVQAGTTVGTVADHNTSTAFWALVQGNAHPFAASAAGDMGSIYCGGCGGLIEGGGVHLDTDADGVVQHTGWAPGGTQFLFVTLHTRIENGNPEAGFVNLHAGGNANSGFSFATVMLTDIDDGLGHHYSLPPLGGYLLGPTLPAPVPEPASAALLLAGGALLAPLSGLRRRRCPRA